MKTTRKEPFWHFVFAKGQRPERLVTALVCVIAYAVLYYCYPYPACKSDSVTYITSALVNHFLPYRPMGYSRFLQGLHSISSGMSIIFIAQLLLYYISATLFILVMKRYYPLKRKWLSLTLSALMTASPLALFMCDSVMSDALFCVSIFMMLSMLTVFLHEQDLLAMILYLLFFWVALFTRYSAMFFPLAFIPILFFVKKKFFRYLAIALTVVIFFSFRGNITRQMKSTFKMDQFSTGFDGWQLANNGIHILPYVRIPADMDMPEEIQGINNFCYRRYDQYIMEKTDFGRKTTTDFIWDNESPLKTYLLMYCTINKIHRSESWSALGNTYGKYGKWLILHYPGPFIRYFLIPNLPGLFVPGTELCTEFSSIDGNTKEISQYYHTQGELKARNPIFLGKDLMFKSIEVITWLMFLAAMYFLLFRRKGRKLSKEDTLTIILLVGFGFLYYGSTIAAATAFLRYWMPMHLLKFACLWFVVSILQRPLPEESAKKS